MPRVGQLAHWDMTSQSRYCLFRMDRGPYDRRRSARHARHLLQCAKYLSHIHAPQWIR